MILEYIDGKSYVVSTFYKDYDPIQNICLINCIVTVDLDDGSGLILELNIFLDLSESMSNSISAPMKAMINNAIVDDIPSLF